MLERPLAALHELQTALFGSGGGVDVNTPATSVVLPVVAFVTPAAGELLLFFGTLAVLPRRPDRVAHLAGRAVRQPRRQAALPANHAATSSSNLAGYLAVVTIINAALGHDRRRRRLADRLSQSGDLRRAGGGAELRALCRAGRHGDRAVRRRPGELSLARLTPSSRRSASSRSPRWKDISSRRPSSAAASPSIRCWCCWRWRSGPGCGGRSAPSSPCRCRSSAWSCSTTCFRPKRSNCPIEWQRRLVDFGQWNSLDPGDYVLDWFNLTHGEFA